MSYDVRELERLQEEVIAGRLTRRDVLKRGLALGLSAPAIAGLLAACGGGDDDDDDDDAAETAEEEDTGAEPTEREAPGANMAATETAEAAGDEPEPTATEAETDDEAEPTPTEAEEDEAEPTATEAEESTGERGGGGLVRLLYWQAPTILNAHFSSGTKDFHAGRVALEPLFEWDVDSEPILYLGAEWPSVENETLDPDGTFVIWKLKQGVLWHDGEEFTAEDVEFTWQLLSNPDTAATTIEWFSAIESIDIVDDYTVQLNFSGSNPAWFDPFSGDSGVILPRHLLEQYLDDPSGIREDEYNLQPIGTGPWQVTEFRPGDVGIWEIFEDYWDPGKPYFDTVEIKGGGDAASAARAVMETGEADWAWNLQVEPSILNQMEEQGGQGVIVPVPDSSTERMYFNFANPNEEVDGAVSEPSTDHPIWQYPEARQAVNLLVDREAIATELYGQNGVATAHSMNVPQKFEPEHSWSFDIEQAQELLSQINFPDDFEDTNVLYQTSVNSVRQKNQEIVKQAMEQVGFTVELKSIDAAVFFSGDPGNPDTLNRFQADLEMYTNGPGSPYPITWATRYRSDEVMSQDNNWTGANVQRYQNPDYDELHDQAQVEIDEERQIEIWHEMLGMVYEDVVEVPIVWRASGAAKHNRIENSSVSIFGATPIFDLKNWTASETR